MRHITIMHVSALVATAAATGLAAGTATSAAASPRPSNPARPEAAAYGVAASGPIRLPATPAVVSQGAEVRKSLARENRKLFSAAALDTRATGRDAHATIKDLKVPDARFSADALTARCRGESGSSHLADARLQGKRLGARPRPNTVVPVQVPGVGTVKVTLNKQQRLRDGRLAVTAMEARVPLGDLGTETISTAAVTCGRAARKQGSPGAPGSPGSPGSPAEPGGQGGPAGPAAPGGGNQGAPGGPGSGAGKPRGGSGPGGAPAERPAKAPKPVPVKGDLPVTG